MKTYACKAVAVLLLGLPLAALEAGSIETQSNPVANGTLTVAPGDNDRSDWTPIPSYQPDPANDAGPELDYIGVQLANDANNLYFHFLLNDITPGTPQFFGFRHNVYLDVDQNRNTGFFGSGGFLPLGADYLFQGPSVFQFNGANQGDFSWTFLQSNAYDDFPTTDVETLIPLSLLGDPDGIDFVINGANTGFISEDFYPDFANIGEFGDFFTYDVGEVTTVSGDFNGNGFFECVEVDALVAEIVAVKAGGTPDSAFDLTGDSNVTDADLDAWLAEAGAAPTTNTSGAPYLAGDANLDGTVDGQDFLTWNNNKFTLLAAWCSGDFNADGMIDGPDFLLWNNNKFTSADGQPSAVPEPTTVSGLLWLAAVWKSPARWWPAPAAGR